MPYVESLPPEEVQRRLAEGWRCVRFESCYSFLIATIRRQSPVYLTENWQERYLRGFGYSFVTALAGPWAVPWGLYFTVRTFWVNLTGGVDVTDEVAAEAAADVATEVGAEIASTDRPVRGASSEPLPAESALLDELPRA